MRIAPRTVSGLLTQTRPGMLRSNGTKWHWTMASRQQLCFSLSDRLRIHRPALRTGPGVVVMLQATEKDKVQIHYGHRPMTGSAGLETSRFHGGHVSLNKKGAVGSKSFDKTSNKYGQKLPEVALQVRSEWRGKKVTDVVRCVCIILLIYRAHLSPMRVSRRL